MKNIFRFFLLLVASIGTTLLLGESFSNYFFSGSGSWIVPPEIVNFVNTFPLIYLFLIPPIFLVRGEQKKWIWIFGSLSLLIATTIYQGSGLSIWTLSAIFFLAGTIVALGINLAWGIIQKRK